MKTPKNTKPYWEMTGDELCEATREFDKEFIADSFSPPDAKAKAQLQRAKRGRPRIGEGCVAMLVSIEQSLLRDLDAFSHRHKTSRSQAISRAVRLLVARKKAS